MGNGDRNELIPDEYGYDGDHLKSFYGLNRNNPREYSALDDAIFELYQKDKIQKLKRKLDASILADIMNVKSKNIIHDKKSKPTSTHISVEYDQKTFDIISMSSDFMSRVESSFGSFLPPQAKDDLCHIFVDHFVEQSKKAQLSCEDLIFKMLLLFNEARVKMIDDERQLDPSLGNKNAVNPNPNNSLMLSPTVSCKKACKGEIPNIDLNLSLKAGWKLDVDIVEADAVQNSLSRHNQNINYKCFTTMSSKRNPEKVDFKDPRTERLFQRLCKPVVDLSTPEFVKNRSTVSSENAPIKKPKVMPKLRNIHNKLNFIDLNNPSCDLLFDECPDSYKKGIAAVKRDDYVLEKISPNHPSNRSRRIESKTPVEVVILPDSEDDQKENHISICNVFAHTTDLLNYKPKTKPSHGNVDVEVLGEIRFDQKTKSTCSKSENLYNKSFIYDHQSFKPVNKDIPHSAVVKGTFIGCSSAGAPPDVLSNIVVNSASKFVINIQERRNYAAVCSLATSTIWYNQYAIDIGGCHVKYDFLGNSMMPGGKVGSFVINAFCRKFFLDERPTKSRKHYFFSSVGAVLLSDTTDYSYVNKCFDGAASVVALHKADMLIFPICHGDHWFLFVVDLKFNWFLFLDSLYSKDDDYQVFVRRKLIISFKHVWNKFVQTPVPVHLDNFRIGYPSVPKQNNIFDCGVFVMKFMELWRPKALLRSEFSQDDIPNIRIQLVNDLVFSEHNIVDTSVVRDFYAEGDYLRVGHGV
ncbi:uncharacterized protein LOC133893628 isoform X2 [Phragmites australis]|uniref:uncharacterized protein LOC133893628 isoform X2 n=1 Tax=Phragmites australis TaxID=29695 RepID=UPI002D7986FF|nr:uncharacterized protein LOC133893628 isoform X2 [Phragmites australis]